MTYARRLNIIRRKMTLQGNVVGVGLRKHVHEIAINQNLAGFVKNLEDKMHVELEGREVKIEQFLRSLRETLPTKAVIETIRIEQLALQGDFSFQIETD